MLPCISRRFGQAGKTGLDFSGGAGKRPRESKYGFGFRSLALAVETTNCGQAFMASSIAFSCSWVTPPKLIIPRSGM